MIDITELRKLDMAPAARERLERALRWVEDSTYYEEIRKHLHLISRPSRPGLAPADFEALCAVRKFVPLPAVVLACCNTFAVTEEKFDLATGQLKCARRPIVEPLINDVIAALDLPVSVSFAPLSVVRSVVASTTVARQFDLVSSFDQVPVAASLLPLFSVGSGHACRTLSMGFKPACDVLEAILGALTPYPLPDNVHVITRVDNILFAGPADSANEAGELFLARAARVGVVLNPFEGVSDSYEFLGESYRHAGQHGDATRTLSRKSRWKLEAVRSALSALQQSPSRVPVRRVCAFFGLLWFCGETQDVLPAYYHFALRFLAGLSSACSRGEITWTTPVALPPSTVTDLVAWADAILCGSPVPVVRKHLERSLDIFVDASEGGWGAIIIDADGGVKTLSFPWAAADWAQWNLASSVAAEPLGILRAACCACVVGRVGKAVIHTDHLPILYAAQHGSGKAYAYSHLLAFLRTQLPTWQFEFVWLPGNLNPADALSRAFCGAPPLLPVTNVGRS